MDFFASVTDAIVLGEILIQDIQIDIESRDLSVFWGVFAYGFKLTIHPGITMHDLLCRQIGITETYLIERIQTVFLNGKAIDDIFDKTVKDKDVIALSAAMPGLVGAVLRKGGILSPLRSDYASEQNTGTLSNRPGQIRLKLFNLIASELGSDFLKQGIRINGDHFIGYVKGKRLTLKSVCRKVVIDGEKYEVDDILTVCRPDGDVFFSVNSV